MSEGVTKWCHLLVFSPSHLLPRFLSHHPSVQSPLPLSSENTAAPSISFISWLCSCYLNVLVCEIFVVILSFQQSLALCRCPWWFPACFFTSAPLTSSMTSARKGSAGRETGAGVGQTMVVSWHDSLASGCCCDIRLYMHGFAPFKALLIMTIPREGNKGSCASCVTAQPQPAWTL